MRIESRLCFGAFGNASISPPHQATVPSPCVPLLFQGQDDVKISKKPFLTVIKRPPNFNPQQPQSVKAYQKILTHALTLARPEVSSHRVGAVVIGNSGKAYLGANIEIKGGLPSDTIHAETAALMLAKAHGETGIKTVIQTLRPCGSCRQVLLEAGNPEMPIHVLNMPTGAVNTRTTGDYLPDSYSYATSEKNMFKRPKLLIDKARSRTMSDSLKAAMNAALDSYLPQPNRTTWAGIFAQTKNGKTYQGSVTTVPAPNNTITPIQDVQIRLAADHQTPADLQFVAMIEPKDGQYSFKELTQAVLEQIAPGAKFEHAWLKARHSR